MANVLRGSKTWEIRGSATKIRGVIALIQSQSGHVVGTCELVDVIGPLTLADLRRNSGKTGFKPDSMYYEKAYAWVLRNAKRLPSPVPYEHPSGAVIWVILTDDVERAVSAGASLGPVATPRARASDQPERQAPRSARAPKRARRNSTAAAEATCSGLEPGTCENVLDGRVLDSGDSVSRVCEEQ